MDCWLGTLPDFIHNDRVRKIQKAHLKKLLDLGSDGFWFDAAKHMPEEVVGDRCGG
jgi:alpha-amylase